MHLSAPFIKRPVATSLLSMALLMAGAIAYTVLPIASLPDVDMPVIGAGAGLPGASPETMASAVATPLERQFSRIAGVNQMTSTSSLGSANVTLQFDINRDINAASRDVQAAINAARSQLPQYLPQNPRYRKSNPADMPILILMLTSDVVPKPQIYDLADSILAQKMSQIQGVGQVWVGGSSSPAVRVELNPLLLSNTGIGLEAVRTALAGANANRPKGAFQDDQNRWAIYDNDQIFKATDYAPIVVGYNPKTGAPVRVSDVGTVTDGVSNILTAGVGAINPIKGPPAQLEEACQLMVFKIPGANVIETVDNVMRELPHLRAALPPTIKIDVSMDRTTTIRASVRDVETSLCISVLLVVLVVFLFLREIWATIIPSVAVPLSLVGTFGIMYLAGYTIDNLSLMALTVATGFVVDDAIVVIENITRYLEMGMRPFDAAMKGSKEIGFTVLSMSVSLVAVFTPILLMGGVVGKLFREFAMTLSVAIAVSMFLSLTTTPMLCARFLKAKNERRHGAIYRFNEKAFNWLHNEYAMVLRKVLGHQWLVLGVAVGFAALNVYLYLVVPKGFFPQQDTGRLGGRTMAAQDVSFAAMEQKQRQLAQITLEDPAVLSVSANVGGGGPGGGSNNTGNMNIALKPLADRPGRVTADQVVNRLRRRLTGVPGATLFLQAQQDLQIGGRGGASQFQYTLSDEDLRELNTWAPQLQQRMRAIPELRDVSTDQQDAGLVTSLVIDRDAAARLGITAQMIDQTLYDAFGQRQVSTMYTALNQYFVVMEVDPKFSESPDALNGIYIKTRGTPITTANSATGSNGATAAGTSATPAGSGATGSSGTVSSSPTAGAGAAAASGIASATGGIMVPLSTIAHYESRRAALQVNHQGQYPAITLAFNLAPNVALGDAVTAIEKAQREMGMPSGIHASFQGTAQVFQDSLKNELYLLLAAIVTVYIVLGILYESLIHPLTILSTVPPAAAGAFLALLITGTEFNIIAMIGIILLIGLVIKNAIMMIDFALQAERELDMSPVDAIYRAALLRFRPIMMTTFAAMFGGLPLAIGMGVGSELRRPLGITIVGGLMVCQALTLFTTPVVYLFFDKLQWRVMKLHRVGSELEEAHGD